MPLTFKSILPGRAKAPAFIISMPVEQVNVERVSMPRRTSRLFPRVISPQPAKFTVVVVEQVEVEDVAVERGYQHPPSHVSNLSRALDDFLLDCMPVAPAPKALFSAPATSLVAEAVSAPEDTTAGTAWTSVENVHTISLSDKFTVTVTDKLSGVDRTFSVRMAKDKSRLWVNACGQYIGFLTPGRDFKPAGLKHVAANSPDVMAFRTWWENLMHLTLAPGTHTQHLGQCCRCQRTLRDEPSILTGIGPECHYIIFGTRRRKASSKRNA